MPLRRHHIEEALAEVRISGFEVKRASRKWDLFDPLTGDRWPPKVILWRAYELAGEGARPGGGWSTNDILEEFGYSIVAKAGLNFADEETDFQTLPRDLLAKIAKRRGRNVPLRTDRTTTFIERSAAVSAFAKSFANGSMRPLFRAGSVFDGRGPISRMSSCSLACGWR